MPARKFWPMVLLMLMPRMCTAHGFTAVRYDGKGLELRQSILWSPPVRHAEFAPLERSTRARCEATRPPEALTTPNPIIDEVNSSATVSFIIGTDGRVHSALILESADAAQDRAILTTIASWRYRPGTCNGVAIESEAKVEFLSGD